jgi:predicted peroxiredoxin
VLVEFSAGAPNSRLAIISRNVYMKKLIALGAAALLLSGVAQAQTQELFVNIHSGNAMAQGAGLVLAGQALEQKASVRVLLCDAAGDMAVAGKQGPKLKPRDVTSQQMLQGVIKAGAKVEVCALYLPNTGLKASDLIEGVQPAKPADVAAHLLKPGVNTLAF